MEYFDRESPAYESDEMDFESRIVSGGMRQEDVKVDVGLRPQTLEEYIGQERPRKI